MRLRKQRGDTLVEVVLAMAIVSMVMVSTGSLGNAAIRLGQDARQRTEVAGIMQQEAEYLRSQRDIALLGSSTSWTTFLNGIGVTAVPPFCSNSPRAHLPIGGTATGRLLNVPNLANTWVSGTTPAWTGGYGTTFATVKTSHGSYDTWVEICSLDGTTNALQFTPQLRWLATSGREQANLDMELANVGNIPLGTLASGTGVIPPPSPSVAIFGFAVRGSLSGLASMYDSGQCLTTAATPPCETPALSWYTTGKGPISCLLNGATPVADNSNSYPRPNDNASASNITYTLKCSNSTSSQTATTTARVVSCGPMLLPPFPSASYGYKTVWTTILPIVEYHARCPTL